MCTSGSLLRRSRELPLFTSSLLWSREKGTVMVNSRETRARDEGELNNSFILQRRQVNGKGTLIRELLCSARKFIVAAY
jgi:hypothetical protein